MNFTLKTTAVSLLRTLIKGASALPVSSKKVIFNVYEGKQYSCNPKYIFEKLYEEAPDAKFVWVLNNPDCLPEKYRDRVKVVKFLSAAHIFELLTSRVIVSNLGVEPFLPPRKGRTFINTWHGGGAYKRVSTDMAFITPDRRKYMNKMRDMRADSTDIFLSSCERFTEVSSRDFNIPAERFLKTGMPRNDRFFHSDKKEREELRAQIGKNYGMDTDAVWVLYAPTFRGNQLAQTDIDNEVCCRRVGEAVEKRFGRKASFMFRSHRFSNLSNDKDNGVKISDFTSYPDMQELLDACDILVTDYSSTIWDYSLTGKPAFLYMPDLAEYLKDRGLYTDLTDWPFEYADNINDFCRLIESYDEDKGKNRIQHHLTLLGSHEDGNATERSVKLIKDLLQLSTP